jgi:hypothetical protein
MRETDTYIERKVEFRDKSNEERERDRDAYRQTEKCSERERERALGLLTHIHICNPLPIEFDLYTGSVNGTWFY